MEVLKNKLRLYFQMERYCQAATYLFKLSPISLQNLMTVKAGTRILNMTRKKKKKAC